MSEFAAFVSNLTNVVIWLLLGPLFAVILFHLGEKRWGTGPTWAFLGFCFNVFALLAFLLLAGYESNTYHSTHVLESQRVRKLMKAASGLPSQQQRLETGEDVQSSDPYIDELLAAHRQADALAYARERRAAAFRTGDQPREALYSRYAAEIEARDAELNAKLDELKRENKA